MKKSIWVALIVVAVVFLPSLFNGVVGDDTMIIGNNSFYESLSNIPLLFTNQYGSNWERVFNEETDITGSVAYRPVLSLTYFLDTAIWKKDAFGFHLTNLLFHLFNVFLVYRLAVLVFSLKPDLAFWSALLFGVHPIQVEAVCAVGFRADLLATCLVLASFLTYDSYRRGKGMIMLCLSWLFYFLAVFSKEAAIGLPLFVLIYDWLLADGPSRRIKLFKFEYIGYVAILSSYLFVYFYVLPNSALRYLYPLGQDRLSRALVIIHIAGYYFKVVCFPWSVKYLPPVFAEDVDTILTNMDLVVGLAILGAGIFYFKKMLECRSMFFGVIWALIFYAPVSNVITLVSPFAHRFIYLPLVGLIVVGVYLLDRLDGFFSRRRMLLAERLFLFVLVLCAGFSFVGTGMTRNNYVSARHMIRDFPRNGRGYLYAALSISKLGSNPDEVLKYAAEAEGRGIVDPRLDFAIGMAHEARGERDAAESRYRLSIEDFPGIVATHIQAGRLALTKKDIDQAIIDLTNACQIKPGYAAVGYLIQALRLAGREDDAREVLNKYGDVVQDPELRKQLDQLFVMEKSVLPVFIGVQ